MVMCVKIGSFNIKDDIVNRRGGLREDGISNVDIITDIILKNKIDLIGCQELTCKLKNCLKKKLIGYNFYGRYRLGSLLCRIPYNENNNIITNKKVLFSKTYRLPLFPPKYSDLKVLIKKRALFPRICTVILFEHNDKKICMINTHLNNRIPDLRRNQLVKLKKIIDKYCDKYPIILTGDFNMEKSASVLSNFIEEMKDYNLVHVDIKKDKNSRNDLYDVMIDHIFVPSDWKINDYGCMDSLGTSDHDYLYVDVEV